HARSGACGPSHSRQFTRCNRFMPSIVRAGAQIEIAIGAVVAEAGIERKRVNAIGAWSPTLLIGAGYRAKRSTFDGTGRSTRCFVAGADSVSLVARAKPHREGETRSFDNGARRYDEHRHSPRAASGTRSPRTASARSLAARCEIFATLGIFLNRTAIQH